MPANKVPYGRPVKLLVDFQGFRDGRLVQFEIWRWRDGKEEKVDGVLGVTKGGKGIGEWNPPPREEVLSLKKKIQQKEVEKYYFIAKIDDKEAKSGDLEFTYRLEIYLVDTDGEPVDGAKCTVTFSDGSRKEGVFEKGYAEFEGAPPGRFTIEVEGFDFLL